MYDIETQFVYDKKSQLLFDITLMCMQPYFVNIVASNLLAQSDEHYLRSDMIIKIGLLTNFCSNVYDKFAAFQVIGPLCQNIQYDLILKCAFEDVFT